MWFGLGILGSLVVVAVSLARLGRRKRKKDIDVGAVSEAWLAEHRGRTSDN